MRRPNFLNARSTGLWEVVNELTRFRRTTRQNYRVTIFGSARLKAGTPAYDGVKQLAAELTKMGCDIISGGGPGLMQAANEGAQSIEQGTHIAPWASAWSCHSSRRSTRSSVRPTNIAPSFRDYTIS